MSANKPNFAGESLRNLNNFVEQQKLDNLLEFHAKTNLYIDGHLGQAISNVPQEILNTMSISDSEINPFFHGSIPCESHHPSTVRRHRSASEFTHEKLDFKVIQSLLMHTFAADENCSRPYPSAGALYPVEVICCLFQSRCENAPASGAYHFRAHHHLLQPLVPISENRLYELLFPLEGNKYLPAFCLIYFVNALRAIVKYSYRGYRHALIEVGAMLQQADLSGQALSLQNRTFSGFSDYEICRVLQIDAYQFLPIAIQAFGRGNS